MDKYITTQSEKAALESTEDLFPRIDGKVDIEEYKLPKRYTERTARPKLPYHLRAKKKAVKKRVVLPLRRHGIGGYRMGCRCEVCSLAKRDEKLTWLKNRRESGS